MKMWSKGELNANSAPQYGHMASWSGISKKGSAAPPSLSTGDYSMRRQSTTIPENRSLARDKRSKAPNRWVRKCEPYRISGTGVKHLWQVSLEFVCRPYVFANEFCEVAIRAPRSRADHRPIHILHMGVRKPTPVRSAPSSQLGTRCSRKRHRNRNVRRMLGAKRESVNGTEVTQHSN
jgi:hypothetical protein